MRIAMVSEHASPLAVLGGADAGGQNVYVARLSDALARRGHEVTVYTRRDSPDLPDRRTLSPGVVVEHVPAGPAEQVPKDFLLPYMPQFGRYLAQRWTGEPPDLVHAHFWMSGMAATLGAHDHGVPVVQTFHALGAVKRRHQGREDTSPYERVEIERRLARRCARTVATCSDEVGELMRLGAPPRRMSVVPCGVDVERFRPDGPADASPRGQRFRLLAAGRLVPRKGYDDAVRALAAVPDAELLVAGGPAPHLLDTDPEADRLRALARRHGVTDRVRLLGAVPQERMPELMRSADLMVSLPHYEPFGMIPLEAMACGLPVVATRVGGHLDTVADGGTGRLVSPLRPDETAAIVRGLLAEPALRRRLGAEGRRRALARYTWERVADGVERVYSEVAVGARTTGVA